MTTQHTGTSIPMTEKTRYVFARSEQSIFSEIYFPKRAAYYGTIFNALRYGYREAVVKRYLTWVIGKTCHRISLFNS